MRQVRIKEPERDFYAPELDDDSINFAKISPENLADWSALKDALREVPMTSEIARLIWPHCQKVLTPETPQDILTKVLWILHEILNHSGSSIEYQDQSILSMISFIIENWADNPPLLRETLSLLERITCTFPTMVAPKSTIDVLLEIVNDPPEWIMDRCNILIKIIAEQITRYSDNDSVCIEMLNLGLAVIDSKDIDASKAMLDAMKHILETGTLADWRLEPDAMDVLMPVLDSGNASLADSLLAFLGAYASLGEVQSWYVIESGCIPYIMKHPLVLYSNVQRSQVRLLEKVASKSPESAAYIISVADLRAFMNGSFDVQKSALLIMCHATRYGVFAMDDELKSFAHSFVESDDYEALYAILQMIAAGVVPFDTSYCETMEQLTTHTDETIACLSTQILT